MNYLTKFAVPLVNRALFSKINVLGERVGNRNTARSLWQLAKTDFSRNKNLLLSARTNNLICSCGCGMSHVHTKGEVELVEFLSEEIVAERKAQKFKTLPNSLFGFSVKYDGADVELIKEDSKEKVVVNFNVNHTVDTEVEPEINQNADKPELSDMQSKPQFEVDVIRGKTTLSFTCSFLEGTPQEGEYNDIFGIDEMCIYEGEWNDKVYAVAGDVLDGYLYDLLMNFLEEKGITNEFIEKMSNLATGHEHSSYIGLLEKLSKFTITNDLQSLYNYKVSSKES